MCGLCCTGSWRTLCSSKQRNMSATHPRFLFWATSSLREASRPGECLCSHRLACPSAVAALPGVCKFLPPVHQKLQLTGPSIHLRGPSFCSWFRPTTRTLNNQLGQEVELLPGPMGLVLYQVQFHPILSSWL